jgi:pectin methylesterase-like acyl-CoA thioesterase
VLRVPHDYPTIQAAVDAAAEGDTVQVKAGVYNENVVVSTSGLKVHARAGVTLDGTGLTGIGIHVRGASMRISLTSRSGATSGRRIAERSAGSTRARRDTTARADKNIPSAGRLSVEYHTPAEARHPEQLYVVTK